MGAFVKYQIKSVYTLCQSQDLRFGNPSRSEELTGVRDIQGDLSKDSAVG